MKNIRLFFAAFLFIHLTGFCQQSGCLNEAVTFTHFVPSVENNFKVHKYNTNDTQSKSIGKLVLEVLPNVEVKYDHNINGIRVRLINFSDSSISQKISHLDVKLICQVENGNGAWVDIENPVKKGFCGTQLQYFNLELNYGEFINFKAPCYVGNKKVKMRYYLKIKEIKVFSDQFDGYINSDLI